MAEIKTVTKFVGADDREFETLAQASASFYAKEALAIFRRFANCAGSGMVGPTIYSMTESKFVEDWQSIRDALNAIPDPAPAEPDDWIEWKGGECPVEAKTPVEVQFADGTFDRDSSNNFDWDLLTSLGRLRVIAYRLAKTEGEK